jgi:FG-GAP-like repeat
MAFRRCVLLRLLLALSLGSPVYRAQPVQAGGAKAHAPTLRSKVAIERHFESLQPRPRPTTDGVVPGSALLEEHRLRAAKVEARVRANLGALPEVSPVGASLPGILLRPSIPAGLLPTSVVTGDFNRDGHMDFVVANGLTNDLWIYPGKGDGTFELPQIIPLSKGLSPVGLAAGDLRGNGNLDLVVAEADSSTIGVLPGNGDGTFGYEQEYALPEPPASVVVDDFNHDGKMDIAAVMVTPEFPGATIPYIALLTGDGTGKFETPIITNSGFYSTAWNIASGDVNGDGLLDLLITGPGNENAQVFLNNGDGTFKAGAIVIGNAPGIWLPFILDGRLADINGDGCADAVVADLNTMIWVSLGDCSGNFTKPIAFQMGANNAAVRLADVNGDGHLDLVTAAFPGYSGTSWGLYGGNSLNVAFGDGKGNFGIARTYVGTSQAYSIGIADFNGDGKPDFVTANNDTDTVTVYQNDGAGGFGFPQGVYAGVPGQGAINAPRTALSFADLNNDGKMDAFILDTGITSEYYATGFLNDGTGKLTGPISSDAGIARTTNVVGDHRLGDFRNTGKLALVAIGQVGSNSTSFILFLTGNGDGTFAKGTPVYTTGANGIMAVADFNKDGKLDFVSVNGSISHTLTTFLGDSNGTFRALAPITFNDTGSSTGGTNAIRAYTGDFNRDGKLDVLVFTSGNAYFTTDSTVWESIATATARSRLRGNCLQVSSRLRWQT